MTTLFDLFYNPYYLNDNIKYTGIKRSSPSSTIPTTNTKSPQKIKHNENQLKEQEINESTLKNNFKNNNNNKKQKIENYNPELDISETKDSFIIEAELPGVNKQDIQIEVKDLVLTIQGEKKRKSLSKVENEKVIVDGNNEEKPTIEECDNEGSFKTQNQQQQQQQQQQQPQQQQQQQKQLSSEIPIKINNNNSHDKEIEIKNYISERKFGQFKRTIDLNKIKQQLDLSTIKTQFNNGILTITIDKKYSDVIKITLN